MNIWLSGILKRNLGADFSSTTMSSEASVKLGLIIELSPLHRVAIVGIVNCGGMVIDQDDNAAIADHHKNYTTFKSNITRNKHFYI